MCGGKKNSNITQEMKSESACKRSAAQLISLCTHPSLWPSQRQPSLSQPVCQRQTVFVNDWALPLRQETRMEREKKKKKSESWGRERTCGATALYLLRMWASSLVTTPSVTARPHFLGVHPAGGWEAHSITPQCSLVSNPRAEWDIGAKSLDD